MDERKLKIVPGEISEIEWELEADGRLIGKTTYTVKMQLPGSELIETHHLDGRVYPAPRLVEEDA